MSSTACLDPKNGIFRWVVNGDDARNPSTSANILFDALGNKVHGITMSGIVPYSSFGSATSYNPNNPQASSAYYRGYQINFPQALDYVPFFSHMVQGPDGTWYGEYIDNQVTYSNNGGIFLPNGTSGTSGAFATNTYILLYYQVINFPNSKAVSTPQAYSYRLFGV